MTPEPHNPYKPPAAAVTDVAGRPGSPVKAVLAGVGVDIGGSVAVSLAIFVAYAASLDAPGLSPAEIASSMSKLPVISWVFIAGTLAGSAFSLLGGYLCARIARQTEYALGFVTGAISATIGLLLSYEQYPLLANVGLTLLTLVVVLVGAHAGALRNRRP